MRKILAITQRVEYIEGYDEYRDCLDQSWMNIANLLDYQLVPLNNNSNPKDIISILNPSIIILSGGNSISLHDNSAKDSSSQRDLFETELLDIAISKKIPVLGVCRGMQIINIFFGGTIKKIENHVNTMHDIDIKIGSETMFQRSVNSFHNYGISKDQLSDNLVPFATGRDNSIEGFHHKKYKIVGIMWHPERLPSYDVDIDLIKKLIL